MASAPIGEIPVLITGDWSDLQDSINAAVQAAEAGAQQIADAMSAAGSAGAGGSVGDISEGIGAASESLSQFGGDAAEVESNLASLDSAISTLDSSFEEISSAGEQADSALTEMSSSFNEVESSAAEVGSSLGEAAGDMADLDSAFEDAASSGAEVSGSMEDVDSSFAELASSSADVRDSLGDIDSAFSEVASTAGETESALSEAAESFDGVEGAAEGIDSTISNAASALGDFDASATNAEGSIGELASSFDELGSVDTAGIEDAGEAVGELGAELPEVATGAGEAAGELEEAGEAAGEVGEGASEAGEKFGEMLTEGLELAGITLTIEAIIDALKDAVTEFGEFQRSEEALGQITKDADAAAEAMEQLPALANQLAVSLTSLEQVQQKFALFGVTLEQMPPLLTAIANSAVASGESFDTVAQSFERMASQGMIQLRSLQSSGLTLEALGNAMGMAGAQATDLSTAMKNLGTDADAVQARVGILELAVQSMGTSASATANDVKGSFQQLANDVTEASKNVGAAIASLGNSQGVQAVGVAIKGIETFIIAMIGYIQQAMDITEGWMQFSVTAVTTIGKSFTQAASGNWTAAIITATQGITTAENQLSATSTKMAADWTANGKLIDGVWASVATSATDTGNIIQAQAIQQAAEWAQEGYSLKLIPQLLEAAGYSAQQTTLAMKQFGSGIDAAAAATAKWNTQWQSMAEKAMYGFMQMEAGTKSASSEVSELNSVIEAAQLNSSKWSSTTADVFARMQVALVQAQAAAQNLAQTSSFEKVSTQIGDIEVAADKLTSQVPVDFQAMQTAIDNGMNFSQLENQLKSAISKMTTDLGNIPAAFQSSLAPALQNTINQAQAALANLKAMNAAATLLGDNKAVNTLATEIQGLAVVGGQFNEDTGQWVINDQQWQAGLANVATTLLSKVIPSLQAGTPASQALITSLNALGPVGQQWAQLMTTDADQAKAALQTFASQAQTSAGTVDLAFQKLGATSFTAAQANVTTFGNDVVKALSGVSDAASLSSGQMVGYENVVLAWANKVWPAIQQGATVTNDVIAAVAKISPAFAQAINQGPAAFGQAMTNLKSVVANSFQSFDAAWQVFGETSENVLNQNNTHMVAALGLMQQQGASLNDQLTGYTKILQNLQLINQQWDQTGQSELATAQTLTQIQLAQFALNNATMGLANEWNTIAQAMGTAWNSLEKGLADALVSGQNFGQAMTKVFTQLAETILEAIVKQALDQMASALITNSGLIQGLGFDMTALGSTAQATQATVASSMAASAASMSASATTMATAMQGSATAITTANSGMVTGVTGDLSVLGPAFTGMTTQVTASTQSMAAAVTAAASQCDVSLQFFGNSTAASMAQASAATTAAASTMVMDIGAIGSALGALAGIVGDLGQSHMDKVLGQIETNTRYTMIYVGQQSQNLLWCAQQSTMYLGLIHGDIVKGLAGGGSSTPQTAAEAAAAAAALAAAQSTGSTATADEGSSSSVDYSDLASDVTATTTAISLTNKLLSSIAITVSEILVMLADTSKTNLSLLMSQMEELVNSDVIQLPLQDIAAALGGTGGLVSQLNTLTATTTTATTATTAAGTAASAAATGLNAVAGATSSVTDGINQMSGAITTTIGTVALTTGEIMAAAAAAGTAATAATTAAQDYTELTGTLTTAAAATATAATNITSASTQLVNAATLAATPTTGGGVLSTSAFVAQNQIQQGIQVNFTLNHTGALVGSGGMQQLAQAVQQAMVQGLQTRGIRVTR
jgi:methyl-accepting chemotaxis protein